MSTLVWPVPLTAVITQRFGENPHSYRTFGLSGHSGVDFGVREGTPVLAAAAGEVERAGMEQSGYGVCVRIKHSGAAGGPASLTLYAHLSRAAVAAGQGVQAGQLIGYSGNTGNSTGPHLHFEVRAPGGPAGYGGAVDPLPLLTAAPAGSPPEAAGSPPEPILYEVVVTAREGVNVRSGPTLSAARLGAQPRGAVLPVFEAQGAWVRTGAGEWICMAYQGVTIAERLEDGQDGQDRQAEPSAWYAALDAWARSQGFTGPALPPGLE